MTYFGIQNPVSARDFIFSSVQTGPGAHTASCRTGTGTVCWG